MFKTIRSRMLLLILGLMAVTSITFIFITKKNFQSEITAQYYRMAKETLESTIRVVDTEYNNLLSYEMNSINHQRALMESLGASILSTADSFCELQKNGLLTESSAKARCLERLKSYQHQNNQNFFVYDMNLTGLFHPNPTMVGKKWSGFEDLKKRDALCLIREIIDTEEKAFTVFKWPRLEDMKPVKQMGLFLYYPQWEWIIGTAHAMADIEKIVLAKEKQIFCNLNKILGHVVLTEIGGILMFDGHGKIILHASNLRDIDLKPAGSLLDTSLQDHLKKAAGDYRVPVQYVHTDSRREKMSRIAFVDYYKPMDWYVAAFVDRNELIRPASDIAARQSVIILVISLFGMGVAFFMSRKIALPLAVLTRYSRALPNSNFTVNESVLPASIRSKDHTDEIKHLADAFAFMESELGKNIRELENHQKNLERLVAMRTQELSEANRHLKQEIEDRKQAQAEREKLIENLQEALDKVKILSGLIPICSKCKKIRDDQGYWNDLEEYLERHSDILFSHGLCSVCLDELYGDKVWYVKSKNINPLK